MMRTICRILLLITFIASVKHAAAQQFYPVNVNVMVVPPVSNDISQLLSVTGGRMTVQLTLNPQFPTMNLKLMGRLERLSPSPLTIAVNPSFIPQQPVIIQGGVPLMLTNNLLRQSFGNLNESNLVFTGTSANALREGTTYKLPEGIYRLCIVAYDMQTSQLVSDPNMGCATFSVCYKASPPQFTQPVNSVAFPSTIPVIAPSSPVIFTWTAPQSTCGLNASLVNYSFEIRQLLPGQTVTDAINNPPVFQKINLPSATFLLDTNLYRNILSVGKKYVTRVRAQSRPGSPAIEIDNLGYSRVEAFQYGNVRPADTTGVAPTPSSPAPSPAPPTTATPSTAEPVVATTSASCGLPAISNKTLLADASINNTDVMMGGFTLHVETATKKSDGSYNGEGYVNWKPLATLPSNIKLAVTFSNVKINTDRVVFEGTAATSLVSGKAGWKEIAEASNVNQMIGKVSPALAREIAAYAGDVQPLASVAGLSKVSMPLGWVSNTGSRNITMAIMRIFFTPSGTDMSLLHSFNISEAGPSSWLSLAGTGFCIKPDGFNFTKGTLYLPSDRSFGIGSGGEELSLTFKGGTEATVSAGSFLNFNAGGIEQIVANTELAIPRSMLVPDETSSTGKVVAKFKLAFKDWEDWMAEGTIPAFQVAGLTSIGFSSTAIVYDHSQKTNPAGIVFPAEYKGLKTTAFDGLYIKKIQVALPEGFRTFTDSKRLTFNAENLIIDKGGFTAIVKANNILSLSTGSLGGWSFSIADINMQIVENSFISGSLNGEILLPVSATSLGYTASLLKTSTADLDYEFTVKPKDNMKMDMLLASLNLDPSSTFLIKKDGIGMAIQTSLKGFISINTGAEKSIPISLPEVNFDELALSNRDPVTKAESFHFSAGTWSFSSPPKSMSGFPVKISKIVPYTSMAAPGNYIAGLQFDIGVELGFGDKSVVSAVTGLDISGKVAANFKSAPKASFNDVKIKDILVKGDVGPVSIAGSLKFYKTDKVFGDGLKGKVAADFKIAKVEGTAQFGKTVGSAGYNYWFIDARAAFSKPVPMVGPLGLAGFGGGAFYNMSFSNKAPMGTELGKAVSIDDNIPGKTASGLNFTPEKGKAGLKATIITALSEPKSFNGDVTLTAVIDMEKKSFSKFGLEGNAYFVTDYPANKNPYVKAAVEASYDIPSTTFNLAVKVDAKFASVTATVPIGVYADPSKWFVKVGDPWGDRVNFTFLDVNTSLLTAKLNANAYLAAGNVLEGGLPPLPSEITAMEGMPADNPETDRLIKEVNKKPGGGFLMGAQIRGDFRASFLFLYAQATAILGFDMMLKHFTDKIECGGSPGGYNNWYAIGQLYAYLKADVGVHVDVWFFEGDLALCKVETGAVLMGGMPNPTWAQGKFAARGEVLGGLVKVNTSFKFEMGDKCFPGPTDPLGDIKIISDYGPVKNGDVFEEPFVVANVPLESWYEISIPPTETKEAEVRGYRFSIRKFSIFLDGVPIPEDGFTLSADNTMAARRHRQIFEPKRKYTVRVECVAEQWYPELSRWDLPYNDKLKRKEEHVEVTEFGFTTGEAPAEIPSSNVRISYPVTGQRYVLKNEQAGSGVVQLKTWQHNLFPGSGMAYELLYVDNSKGDTIRSSFTPDASASSLKYKLPPQLKNDVVYKAIFRTRKSETTGDFRNQLFRTKVTESTRKLGSDGEVTISSRLAMNTSKEKKTDGIVYSFTFGTSKYNSLSEKLNAAGDWKGKVAAKKMDITNANAAAESFDVYETRNFTFNGAQFPPLLNVQIGWDPSKQNDQYGRDKLYKNALVLSISGATIHFGMPEVRREIYNPVNTIDWTKMLTSPAIPVASTKSTGSGVKVLTGGTAMYTSGINFSALNTTSSAGAMPGPSLAVSKHKITWNREGVMQNDHQLLQAFAKKIIAFQKSYQAIAAKMNASALEDDSSPQLYTTNGIGGYAYIPLNKLAAIYNSSVNMNILRAIASGAFQPYPKSGSRNLQFTYGLKGFTGSPVNKTLSYN